MTEENTEVVETEEVEQVEEKTYTQAELDRKISEIAESTKQKTQQQLEAGIEERIKEEREEAERLAQLSEKERADAELTKREQELADRLVELEKKELKTEAIADLNKKELPAEFADFLLDSDAEGTLENINQFKEAFDGAVNEKVKEALRQETPKGGGAADITKLNKDDLSVAELIKLKKESPEQYTKLMGNK